MVVRVEGVDDSKAMLVLMSLHATQQDITFGSETLDRLPLWQIETGCWAGATPPKKRFYQLDAAALINCHPTAVNGTV